MVTGLRGKRHVVAQAQVVDRPLLQVSQVGRRDVEVKLLALEIHGNQVGYCPSTCTSENQNAPASRVEP